MRVNPGDSVTTVNWTFNGRAFDGQPILITLRDYLERVTALLEEAERKMAP